MIIKNLSASGEQVLHLMPLHGHSAVTKMHPIWITHLFFVCIVWHLTRLRIII